MRSPRTSLSGSVFLVLGLAVAGLGAGCGSEAAPALDAAPQQVDAPQSNPWSDDAGQADAPPDGSEADGGAPDAGTVSPAADAGPTVACTSLTNPIFVLSGDTQVPILKQVGKVLRGQSNPTTIVWFATGSCSIYDTIFGGSPMTANGSYIPSDPAWDAKNGAVPTCTMPPKGVQPDLGIPIVFAESCTSTPAPAGLGVIRGPVQTMVFVVPTASSASAISAEEAYLVFGLGSAGGVAPWLDESFYFVRPASKGTQVSLGATIGVPAAKWKGNRLDKSTDVAAKTASTAVPDSAIGILGSEIYDSAANRAVLRTLSLQGYQQSLGYLPDSSATAFDKRNVRDGHYPAWSHVIYLTPVDAAGAPTNARVAPVLDAFNGGPSAAALGIDTIKLAASNGLIPVCAMTVARAAEGGPLSVKAPQAPCGCAYEAAVGQAPAACVPCKTTADCATGTCSYGYCESPDGRTTLADCTAPTADQSGIINAACSGRTTSAKRPVPQKQKDNGGVLPALP